MAVTVSYKHRLTWLRVASLTAQCVYCTGTGAIYSVVSRARKVSTVHMDEQPDKHKGHLRQYEVT